MARNAAASGILLPPVASYKDKPIDYIDPAPKPFDVQIPLVEFFERVKRHKADRWQHDFCERLQNACINRSEMPTRAIVHAEAQLGKSVLLAQCLPAWIFGHDSLHRVALSTYNVTRSQSHSKAVISIMNLPIYKQIFTNEDCHVKLGSSKEKWMTNARLSLTTDAQDSFNPVGLQSGLTGSGFDTLIIDDPYASERDAFSETIRKALQSFWDADVESRIGSFSNVFGMFHRYHVQDLAGYLLDNADFDYWRYASVCDGDYVHEETGKRFQDPMNRAIGEYISERRAPSYYITKKQNSRTWNSMFQGKPTSDSGEFFIVGQIQTLTPEQLVIRKQECSVFVRAWDLAATEEGGDYSVGELWGMSPDNRATLFDVKREQVESAGRDELQLRTAKEDGFDVVVAVPNDPGAAGNTAVFHIQQLLKGYTVVPRSTSGSKIDRARSLASAVNAGQVTWAEAEWNKTVKTEWRDFPLSDKDDTVDSGADGYNECFERVSKGLVVKGFSNKNLKTWQSFAEMLKLTKARIPAHWTLYAGVKITQDAARPNSAVIVAQAAQNANLSDETLFIVAEYKEYTADFTRLFAWIKTSMNHHCLGTDITVWLHPDSAMHQQTIMQKLEMPVQIFKHGASDGVTELNWYLASGGLFGLIADETQIAVALDADGMHAVRQEAATWGYNDKNEPSQVGGVLDCLRMIAWGFRTVQTPLTREEAIAKHMPPHLGNDTRPYRAEHDLERIFFRKEAARLADSESDQIQEFSLYD